MEATAGRRPSVEHRDGTFLLLHPRKHARNPAIPPPLVSAVGASPSLSSCQRDRKTVRAPHRSSHRGPRNTTETTPFRPPHARVEIRCFPSTHYSLPTVPFANPHQTNDLQFILDK